MNSGEFVMNPKMGKMGSSDFNPIKEKAQLIKICGHYVLSHNDFVRNIKSFFPKLTKIKNNIIKKLNTLHETRPKTIFCDIDGTLVKHQIPTINTVPNKKLEILPGTIEKLSEWDAKGIL